MKQIGTLNEKSIHSMLKSYFEEDSSKHEISINGYIADIFNNGIITEIQTKDFARLRNKLDAYTPDYKVRVVYPVNLVKYINWVDPNTQEVLERRKSPCRTSSQDIFKELYKIREYLTNSDITFTVVLLQTEEYKYLDGYGKNNKNHATKIDKIPTSIIDEINFNIDGGYEKFIPYTLNTEFTSTDFSKAAHCNIDIARTTLLILYDLNIIDRVGKEGRKYLYKLNIGRNKNEQ